MEFVLSLSQPTSSVIDFDLTTLGYDAQEEVPLYDIWAKESAGVARGTLSTEVPKHGVKLYRLGNQQGNGIVPPTEAVRPSRASGVITLQGVRLHEPIETLPAGIYIVDDKKVCIE